MRYKVNLVNLDTGYKATLLETDSRIEADSRVADIIRSDTYGDFKVGQWGLHAGPVSVYIEDMGRAMPVEQRCN